MSILPNRILGTVGEHSGGFPVESLSLSHCGRWLASCSHDQTVKFSDVREVLQHGVESGRGRLPKRTNQRAPPRALSSRVARARDFFGDLDRDRAESAETDAGGGGGGGGESSSEDDSSASDSDSGAAAAVEAGTSGRSSESERRAEDVSSAAAAAAEAADSDDKASGDEVMEPTDSGSDVDSSSSRDSGDDDD